MLSVIKIVMDICTLSIQSKGYTVQCVKCTHLTWNCLNTTDDDKHKDTQKHVNNKERNYIFLEVNIYEFK